MKTVLLVILVLICTSGLVCATTNTHNLNYTTTAGLSTGAWNPDASISNDRINYLNPMVQYRYVSPSFAFPNGTYGYQTKYSLVSDDEYDEGYLYSNSLWLNSSDYRHVTGGHAYYSFRFPCTVTPTSSGGTYDAWYTDSSGCEKATYSGNTQVVDPAALSNVNANYLAFDGVDDYATIPMPTGSFDFENNYWTMAFMINNTYSGTTTAHPITINNASAAYPTIQLRWIDSTTKYWAVYVQDSAGNTQTYYSSSNLTTKNAYHYIVVKCDSTNIMLYDNGVLKCKGAINVGAGHLKMTQVVFGGKLVSGTLTNDFTGRLDEIRFMRGDLPISYASNSSAMASYMWNCTKGIANPLKTQYKISASGSAIYQTVYCVPATGPCYTYDLDYLHMNTWPRYTTTEPLNGTGHSSPVSFYVNGIHDADSSYDAFVWADFYVDGKLIGTRDGWLGYDTYITYDGKSLTGGPHTWYARYYDLWGGSMTTPTKTFNVTGRLYFRDEQDSTDFLNGVSVTVSFYSDNQSETCTTADGYIDLTGLPTENMLVTADAPGYISRKTILETFYIDDSIYLINETAEVMYNSFKLNAQTLTSEPSAYRIRLYKPMTDGLGLVFSSYFDFDGTCGTYMIVSDAYKLQIVAPDDTIYDMGWVYPDPDGVLDINLQSLQYTTLFDNWLSFNYTSDKDNKIVRLSYNSTSPVSEATMIITDEHNNTLYNVTVSEDSYVFQYIATGEVVCKSTVHIESDAGTWDSSFYTSFIDDYVDMFPDEYPGWLKLMFVTIISLVLLLGFSSWRADVGAIMSVGFYSFAVYMEEIEVNGLAISILVICALGAIIKHRRRQKRM